MAVSSERIDAFLPVYLVTVLGTSATTVGIIEGIAKATAPITKMFSGALSDWLGKRKLLAVLGYGLAAFTKPVSPLAPSVSRLVAAGFIDRVGKGIRGAPRDVLAADIVPAHLRGAGREAGAVLTSHVRNARHDPEPRRVCRFGRCGVVSRNQIPATQPVTMEKLKNEPTRCPRLKYQSACLMLSWRSY